MSRAEPPGGTEQPVRVRVHPALCEGWGECHRWGGAVYPLDEEGQVAIERLEVPPEHARDAWLGAMACPARAISYLGPLADTVDGPPAAAVARATPEPTP